MSATIRFRRLVLELGHGAADPQTMRQAAAFARLLDAELHALFVEDETLLHASQLPFSREISLVSHQWRPLEPDRLEAELRAAADQARRNLTEVARVSGVRLSFEISRGDLGVLVTGICAAGDIVVVASPRRMGSGTTHGFQLLRQIAHRSAASVLFLPRDTGRRHGPVVAVASGEGDPSLAVAQRIAGESPIVVPPTALQDILATLGDLRERLIVMTRADDPATEDIGAALAAARGVPVLVVEPD
jgi:hypothetical protein